MNISKAITQWWEECVLKNVKMPYKSGYNTYSPREGTIALDVSEQHRNHAKEHYLKALERVIESLEEWIKENTYTEIHKSLNWGMESEVQVVHTSDVLDHLNQAKDLLQKLNQK